MAKGSGRGAREELLERIGTRDKRLYDALIEMRGVSPQGYRRRLGKIAEDLEQKRSFASALKRIRKTIPSFRK